MAENLNAPFAGTAGPKLSVDTDVSSVNWPYSKLVWGADQTYNIIDLTHALPVQPGTGATFPISGAITVSSGTIAISGTTAISAASLPLPTGASTETTLASLNTKVTACNTGAVIISSGTVSVSGSVAVTGTFWQATQPVSAVSLPLPTGAAQDATLTGGSAVSIAKGGTKGTTTAAVITSNPVDGNTQALHVNLAGTNTVTISGTSPVSGTVAATQSGSWSVSTTGTTAISAASLPLPTGAATAAKQPAIGTAGVSSTDVISVQGIASGTAMPVSGTVTANAGTNLNTSALALDTTLSTLSGKITACNTGAVVISSGTVAISGTVGVTQSGTWTVQPGNTANTTAWKVDGSAVTQPVSGTVTANAGTGTFAVSAASLPLPSGASTAAKQPALGTAGSASSDVLSVQGVASMTALKVDGSAVIQPISGTITANIGTSGSLALDATITGGTQKSKLVDSGGTNVATVSAGGALKVDASATTQPVSGTFFQTTQPTSLASLPALAAGTNTIGNVGSVPITSGGLLINRLLSANSTNATLVKSSAGQVYQFVATNTGANPYFFKLFNSGTIPTAGSGTPVLTYMIPGNTAGAGLAIHIPQGIAFSSGIGYTVTGLVADNDTTAVALNQAVLDVLYF